MQKANLHWRLLVHRPGDKITKKQYITNDNKREKGQLIIINISKNTQHPCK